jgi:hypothetical protein
MRELNVRRHAALIAAGCQTTARVMANNSHPRLGRGVDAPPAILKWLPLRPPSGPASYRFHTRPGSRPVSL